MTTLESFLAAILTNPQDESARAVFADWLEQQGDPRARDVRRFTIGQVQRGRVDLVSGSSAPVELGWAVGAGFGRIGQVYWRYEMAAECLVRDYILPLFGYGRCEFCEGTGKTKENYLALVPQQWAQAAVERGLICPDCLGAGFFKKADPVKHAPLP